jgi:hypothetical protein
VGHVARLLEEAGIATVIIAVEAFRDRLVAMKPPRVVLTPHWMGRPLGRPGDAATQRAVLLAALDLLENARENGALVEFRQG